LRGEKKLALQFLEKAFQKGFHELDHMDNDTDWETLRNDPQFQELKRRYTAGK